MDIALFHSTIRGDEKLLIEAARKRKINLRILDIRDVILSSYNLFDTSFDLVINRCVSNTKGRYLTFFLESQGVRVINSYNVVKSCEDKFVTSTLLEKKGILTPKFGLAFNFFQAKDFIDSIGGYPVVLKPTFGSWGRFMAKVNDDDALEALLEHKSYFQAPYHKAFYIQKFIEKKGRDIRAFYVGGRVIAAIYRESKHWITNTARGGRALNCPINPDLEKVCRGAAQAVGDGILAMDIFETENGYMVNEVNHTMEFKNSEKPTGVSISGEIIDYCINLLKK